MRLLTVGSLPPEWGGPVRGGAASFHATLLTELGRREEIDVVGVLPPGPLERELPIPVFPRPEGISHARHYERLLDRLRPDVVLMSHIAHTAGVTHSRLGSPVPALGVVHSWHNVTFRSGEERRRAVDLTSEALNGMTGLAMPSLHGLAEGSRLGLRYPAIAKTIPNPLQHHLLANAIDVVASERCHVAYVGGLIPRKNPVALVEAATLLPQVKVLLAGEGELEEELRRLIERYALADRVRLAGLAVGPGHLRDVRDLLLGARSLCLPSQSESFGLVFIEALACGAPVVGFGPTLREIRDAMGIDVGEPLDTGSAEEVAGALGRVMAMRWDRERLRRAAIDSFGPSPIADRYVALLRRVAGVGGG